MHDQDHLSIPAFNFWRKILRNSSLLHENDVL